MGITHVHPVGWGYLGGMGIMCFHPMGWGRLGVHGDHAHPSHVLGMPRGRRSRLPPSWCCGDVWGKRVLLSGVPTPSPPTCPPPRCYEDCGHGYCSGAPNYTCVCHLGWTSPPANATGHGDAAGDAAVGDTAGDTAALCSVDCGCHFHSSCETAGPGVCDRCQSESPEGPQRCPPHRGASPRVPTCPLVLADWTHGERCQLCRPGSFGDATGPGGCRQCRCHGHGQPERGHCHGTTGACFCAPPTEGPHCERCAPGYFGDPR